MKIGEATDDLHATSAVTIGDITLKLAATIAAGPPGASTFPWIRLRQVFADVVRLVGAGP